MSPAKGLFVLCCKVLTGCRDCDWVKIVDFGISNLVQGTKKLTKTGRMVGTPVYIAPEQLKDRPIDIRTDLYAVGVMMFEMLTGKVPFDGESPHALFFAICRGNYQPLTEAGIAQEL